MFQFRRFPTYAYLIQRRLTEYCSAGFPHSEICGSKLMCSSPQLIAACHVLHRLLMPRHSPCALSSLTFARAIFTPVRLPLKQNTLLRSLAPFGWFMNYAGIYRSSFRLLLLPFTRTASAILLNSTTFCFLPSVACSFHLLLHIVQFSRCSAWPLSRSD